jgi:hypothetical protein
VHVAFLLDDAHFDRALARIRDEGREHWADPQRTRPGETNTEHGGRGVYMLDPAGHYLELITRPTWDRRPGAPARGAPGHLTAPGTGMTTCQT